VLEHVAARCRLQRDNAGTAERVRGVLLFATPLGQLRDVIRPPRYRALQPRARSTDLLIAATAHAHSAWLYTRNADDFDGLGDLIGVVPV
jgi:hypothetical protein